jgi:hypothetical protein
MTDELWRQKLIDAAEVGLRKDCQSKPCVDVVHRADAIRAVDAILQSGLVKENP